MNFELSLALIWLFLFSLLSLPVFFRSLVAFFGSFKKTRSLGSALPLLSLLFPLYLSLTFFWSLNPLRTVLTSGILWCLYISVFSLVDIFNDKSFNRSLFKKVFLGSAIFICLVCWLQCFLDTFGVSRDSTLLCLGCTSRIFGFPHPSGFAIEPQFMGNLLLTPTSYAFYLFLKSLSFPKKSSLKPALLSLFFATTLFLIFSRGAIYSFSLAFAAFLLVSLLKLKSLALLKSVPIYLASLVLAILAQGCFASFNAVYKVSFPDAVSASVSQLTLGRVNLLPSSSPATPETAPGPAQKTDSNSDPSTPPASSLNLPSADQPIFSGYIEESTNVRVGLNRLALGAATSTTSQLLFGSGLGSAGSLLYSLGKIETKAEIVQNEYLSLLLETGIVGILLAVLVIVVIFTTINKILPSRSLESYLIFSLILSFALSLNFFSGLPNALHLYLFPVILLPLLAEHKPIIN